MSIYTSYYKVKVAVFGASGYTGIELLRLLLKHPKVELVAVTSRTSAGKVLSEEFPRFKKVANADQLSFTLPDVNTVKKLGAEIAFLALPHGVSVEYAKDLLAVGLTVIDLSADFRLKNPKIYKEYYDQEHLCPELLNLAVYALPEIRADKIKKSKLIACPGCYPTSILIPLIPLFQNRFIDDLPINIVSMSGATGAGRKESISLLFCEINESVRSYSVPTHRHMSEIGQELEIAAGRPVAFSFVPHLLPVQAGIATTIFVKLKADITLQKVQDCLELFYKNSEFVRLLGENKNPDTKNVVGTNFIDVGWSFCKRTQQLILLSAEDNIGKGAASQAIQNMNIICGFKEAEGLKN
jgi:N-acetyl-gamma-glutamyl-phosphate reductase